MTEPASQLPALKPCPACGGPAAEGVARELDGSWVACDASDAVSCWSGPRRSTRLEARAAWNALPRLVDGLRPEAHAPPDVAETLAWLCRALTTLALRHGVTLPPFPRRPT